jgi:hypothetical protein
MKNYALVQNGIVINISQAEADWDSTGWIEYENAGIGWNYDGIKFYPDPCHDEAILNDYQWICDNTEHDDKVFE